MTHILANFAAMTDGAAALKANAAANGEVTDYQNREANASVEYWGDRSGFDGEFGIRHLGWKGESEQSNEVAALTGNGVDRGCMEYQAGLNDACTVLRAL